MSSNSNNKILNQYFDNTKLVAYKVISLLYLFIYIYILYALKLTNKIPFDIKNKLYNTIIVGMILLALATLISFGISSNKLFLETKEESKTTLNVFNGINLTFITLSAFIGFYLYKKLEKNKILILFQLMFVLVLYILFGTIYI